MTLMTLMTLVGNVKVRLERCWWEDSVNIARGVPFQQTWDWRWAAQTLNIENHFVLYFFNVEHFLGSYLCILTSWALSSFGHRVLCFSTRNTGLSCHSWYQSAPAVVYFFQTSVLISIENVRFWLGSVRIYATKKYQVCQLIGQRWLWKLTNWFSKSFKLFR